MPHGGAGDTPGVTNRRLRPGRLVVGVQHATATDAVTGTAVDGSTPRDKSQPPVPKLRAG